MSRQRDVYLDLGGGNRIPKISERKARSVAELRAAGVGVDRVLVTHDGSVASSDLLQAVLTMLDPGVMLGLVRVAAANGLSSAETPPSAAGPSGTAATGNGSATNGPGLIDVDLRRARKLGRELEVHTINGDWSAEVVRVAHEGNYDLIILPLPAEREGESPRTWDARIDRILRDAHCRVFLAVPPSIPHEVDEEPPASHPTH